MFHGLFIDGFASGGGSMMAMSFLFRLRLMARTSADAKGGD
jgi:hypothetical protein